MAKKRTTGGGRVTAKGTRPEEPVKGPGPRPDAAHRPVARTDPGRGRLGGAGRPAGPTRSNHHRGQR